MARTGWMMVAVSAALMGAPAAHAVGLKDCSLKYKAAKTAGTLNGADWKTFRATQCGAAAPAVATPAASTTTAPAAPAVAAATPAATVPTTAVPAGKPSAATGHPAATGNATFPTAIDPKYAKLSAGKARMKTCLDQYHANKGSGASGGLKWIAKDGYYSQCNTRLKGT